MHVCPTNANIDQCSQCGAPVTVYTGVQVHPDAPDEAMAAHVLQSILRRNVRLSAYRCVFCGVEHAHEEVVLIDASLLS